MSDTHRSEIDTDTNLSPGDDEWESFDRPDIDGARPSPDFIYQARIEEVTDGDTVEGLIDLGFDTHIIQKVRLRGIDANDVHFVSHDSDEYERGLLHREFAKAWVADAVESHDGPWPLALHSHEYERGKYGRVVGDFYAYSLGHWLTEAVFNAFEDVTEYEG